MDQAQASSKAKPPPPPAPGLGQPGTTVWAGGAQQTAVGMGGPTQGAKGGGNLRARLWRTPALAHLYWWLQTGGGCSIPLLGWKVPPREPEAWSQICARFSSEQGRRGVCGVGAGSAPSPATPRIAQPRSPLPPAQALAAAGNIKFHGATF